MTKIIKRDKKLDKQYLKLLKDSLKHGVGEKEFLRKKIKEAEAHT